MSLDSEISADASPSSLPFKHRTLRRELSIYILGLTLFSACFYTLLLTFYYERGFAETAHVTLRVEMREYAKKYAIDPATPLPKAQIFHFRVDDWQAMPEFFQQVITQDQMDSGDAVDVEWSPNGHDEWEGARFIVGQSIVLSDGKRLYGIVDHEGDLLTDDEKDDFDRQFYKIFFVGGVFISLMVFIVWFFNRRMQRYTNALAVWAEGLSMKNINQEIPDFRYQELNRIGHQLHGAFDRISRLLEREHLFLRNASHELRTPIAVVRANMELLDKMGYDEIMARPLGRINRANKGMQQLIETLLWLSRENEAAPQISSIHPTAFLEDIIEDLKYLLDNKPVVMTHDFSEEIQSIELPVTPLRIVLANLIRNAFQHTQEGQVSFTLTQDSFQIENQDSGTAHGDSDDSFGLGLMMVQQICERMQWPLELEHRDNGVRARLIWGG